MQGIVATMDRKASEGASVLPPLIAHVIYRLDVGGLENGLVNLINRLPRNRYRHTIVCLTDYTGFRRRIKSHVPVYALHKQPGKDPELYVRLWRLFRHLRPDIVHTRNLATLEAQLPALLAGVRHRVHGEHGRDVHDLDNTSRKYRLLRAAFRPMVQRYIPLSVELRRYLEDEVGVPERKIRPICNGVDTARFHPGNGTRHARLPQGFALPESIVIGTVGRMEAVKDQVTLARSFLDLVDRLPDGRQRLRLLMIGDGPLREQCRQILTQAGMSDLAWLPGTRSDVPEMLRAMDVFCLPSLAEGISNTILESMASGLPVVATAVGGNGELVVEGVTGLLVPRANPTAMATALSRYVDDAELRKAHAASARVRAEAHFSLDNMVRQYQAVYDELLFQPLVANR